MNLWKDWKKGFDSWEAHTAKHLETVLRNPTVLNPAGQLLSTSMKLKSATDKAVAAWWSAMGLPTKRDQERTLHAINQLQSRIYDLEDRLADQQKAN